MAIEWREDKGVRWLEAPAFAHMGARAIFTSRLAGVSPRPYASLNLAFHVGDETSRVLENRRRLSDSVGLPLEHWTTASQVHGKDVAVVDSTHVGAGALRQETALAETDSLMTGLIRKPLVLFFADCLPVFIADHKKKLVGLAHAGRAGTVLKITSRLVKKMVDEFGTDPKTIYAFLGPSIRSCCYRVGDDIAADFEAQFSGSVIGSAGRRRIDLTTANKQLLDESGIPRGQISDSELCTCCDEKLFYSFRREKLTGRHGAIVYLV